MAGTRVEFADFAGIDSRSSPLRLPPGRSLRNKNWVPKPNGILQLRHGYTKPTFQTSQPDSSPIHSAGYFELHDGTQFNIFSQGIKIRLYAYNTGSIFDVPGTVAGPPMSNANKWNGVFADNIFMLGNGDDRKFFDGDRIRDIGLPSPATNSTITVSYSTASTGTWQTTSFLGYQLFMCLYNPTTGAVGNRVPIGNRLTVTVPNGVVNISGLPDISLQNGEWVRLIGRTGDNGLVPNALVDASGTFVVIGNAFTTGTIVSPTTDPESELPTRNDLPPRFDKISYALGRACVIDEDDPSGIRYSETMADVPSGLFVGDPRQSWPRASKIFFPTGERCRSIHNVGNDHWVWTRNHVGILSEFQATDSSLGRPILQWQGIFVGGIANHRAFAQTKYGPFWVSAERQLMTRAESGPIPVSTLYDAALLARIADLESIEVAYLLDPEKDIDCLYIVGNDAQGAQVIIVHDFGAGGIGREHLYNTRISTFVRNPNQIVSARDTAGKMRLWGGIDGGVFGQFEDGDDDAGATYSADCVMMYNGGPKNPTLGAIEWFGDSQVDITITQDLRLTLPDLDDLDSLESVLEDENTSLWRAQVEEKAQYMLLRFQLDSHAGEDGTLARSSPIPGIPLETYGRIYMTRPEIGMGREIGGSKP